MNKKIYTQVVVIGSGPAGYSAAFRCADLGLDTVLIERYDKLGGVCLNVGCIPSKTLLHIAKVIKEAKELHKTGVSFNKPDIDIKKIKNWKQHIVNKLTDGLSSMRKKRKIRIFQGHAIFETDKSLCVTNTEDKFTIFFDNAIIATGSKPIKIPSIPHDDIRIWDSTDALSLKKIPNNFLIIGSGIIGLEMATIYSALGSKVDIIDRFNHFLPVIDEDISSIYKKSINQQFNLMLNTHIDKVEVKKDALIVDMIHENIPKKNILYDAVLVAIGRTPNIDSLGLDRIGLKINNFGFIQVNNQLKTNIPHIYAIGDVAGTPMLAHKGVHEGHIAAEVISGKNHYFEPKVIPSIAYTDPEIAWVGLSEKEAKQENINYEVAIFPWNASGRAIASNCSIGKTKLIFNKQNNKIIGGSIVGSNAGELIGEVGLAIEMGCDAEDIALTIHAHPTLSESIGLSAEVFQGTVTDVLNFKLNK
ncbi:dihydrolipoyl dehydrogenase [Buchnera aphidicola str. APS (Acyrthosiphon pisum)]|uniref:Dihydrolipoyl dehydrogenase n=2 Tax=Buchnera aphidicola TaxID=9 RepID=DLDH_BUCAI|nr:dihydrolipoyl dehydrogenase [Buchnera aphidicola]P57303.1 RecName: Full=Dihydrolipoyl dehydrogenase; AltName: Full=Dihydrolipoamide dehydrogenase; AltName: Full=E3 component of pyruvate and 2-oxoglutarate dehydrogenases complexes [Buchnera aphidicola str. APS (Acyrthosiphon pisum)]pir/D84954/ dihydrolipoamide dehydrogenase (EC 1.8.1.4) [imported] - Buchnera sp. (strain APS) [Buchnera sp. (in: enterobacteria)]ADP66603.1 dihydrolipoamide dehydrogenase [Buchnera aphidicola str. TLW03 (Acyrthosip